MIRPLASQRLVFSVDPTEFQSKLGTDLARLLHDVADSEGSDELESIMGITLIFLSIYGMATHVKRLVSVNTLTAILDVLGRYLSG